MLSRAVPVLDVLDVNNFDTVVKDVWYINMCRKVLDKPEKYSLWRVEDGKLFKHITSPYPELRTPNEQWKLVVPREHRSEIIKQHHDPPTCGHLGVFKTTSRILEKFYWPLLRSDVARYIRKCPMCLSTKPEQKAMPGQMLSSTPYTSLP